MSASATLARLTDLPDWPQRLTDFDPIFFEASATTSFRSEEAKAAFRRRWLGRYLETWPHLTHVALGPGGLLLGYIVGAHENPATDPRFDDIGYFRALAPLCTRYPAHLHINLAPDARGMGLGTRLVDAFLADARMAGCPGVHLVTGRDSRNRSFYARNGFTLAASLDWGGTPIVMLARAP
ncbi:MAG: GNAT family N-acetyltransferase [Hyphomicrobiaceae bacterium]